MRKQIVQLEWHCFEHGKVDDQAWSTVLAPVTEVIPEISDTSDWRTDREWPILLAFTILLALLLWVHLWARIDRGALADQRSDIGRITVIRPAGAPTGELASPQSTWRPMLNALSHYFQLRRQQDTIWRYIARRPLLWQQASTLPLAAFLPDDLRYRAQIYGWSATVQDEVMLMAGGTFAEYISTTYGQTRLWTLLTSFDHYDNWHTLSPAVFGIPASELELGWHTYVAQQAKQAQ